MGRTISSPAVFLDRDGTVIYDAGYPHDPEQVALLSGAGEALADLARSGFKTVIVSNQSGIGRGFVTEAQATAVHERFVSLLESLGVRIDGAYYCPHSPDDGCTCRKPSPELLLRAAEELDLDLGRSIMVGDKASDVEAGRRAGCTTILLAPGPSAPETDASPDHLARSWAEVTAAILEREAGAV